ncbi:MAG TPA: beta-ketoacyl synthase N-terminal-like domain-containing protein, partial [Acidimicrobiia bacterium]|nr:beta-ketoacyl synthase N-terminal-like domain-containing protein [Acidimicrobiia bacterium]
MRDVFIAGTGMTNFGKGDRSIRALAEESVAEALRDAQTTAGDVGMVFFSNATAGILTGQEMIRGQVALRNTGLLGTPIVNVENACASASSAFFLAHMAVASGAVDIALAIGSEKLTHPDKMRSFAAIGTAVDLDNVVGARESLTRTLLGMGSAGPDAGSPLPV